MNKLKRYLGLAVAVALLALAFVPFEKNSYYPMASKATPLDGTVLAKLTGAGGRDMDLWAYATDYINRCVPFQETSRRSNARYGAQTCEGNDHLFSTTAHEYETELSKFEPALPTLRKAYLATPKVLKEAAPTSALASLLSGATTTNSIYLRGLEGPVRDPQSLKLELQIGTAMSKYLQSVHGSIATSIYLVHGLAILLFIGLVFARESVGALLLWPFSLIFGAAKAGTKVAKSLHDKV